MKDFMFNVLTGGLFGIIISSILLWSLYLSSY